MRRRDIFIGLMFLGGIFPAVSAAQTTQAGFTSATSPVETRIKESFDHYRSRFIQDKLFVHTDKGTYIPGEIVWFRIYYLDAIFNRPGTLSKIAYVELLDRDNRPVLQEKISLKPGEAMGSMVVPVNLPSGYYKLRAYTRWMKNFSQDLYFEKPLLVINPLEQQQFKPVTAARDTRYDIQFFPEGGNLVDGISSRVGFRVTDAYGKGLEFGGLLINGKGDTVLKFRPLAFGIGHFDFTPLKGESYRAVILFPAGGSTEKKLPEAFSVGYTLSLVRDATGGLVVKEKVSAGLAGKDNYLFVHGRSGEGRILSKQTAENGVEFQIAENDLEDGLNQFTLFNESGAPVCERVYFKYPQHPVGVSLATDSLFGERKKIDIQVALTKSDKDSAADMSLAIYRIDSLQDIDPVDIRNWQWLECETGPVESASWYFDENNKMREEAMDNLLLTQGWRRYAWPVMTADPPIAYSPEFNGHLAEGRVVDPVTGKPLGEKEVFLSVPSRRAQISVTTSNSEGRVKFELRNFYGSSEIILQTELSKDSTSRIEISDPFSTQFGPWRLPEFKGGFRNSEAMLYRGIYEQAQRIYHHASYNRFLSEYADTNTFYFSPDEKYMLDDFTRFQTMEEVIREYVVSTNVTIKRNKFQLHLADRPHEAFFTDAPLILIDGVPYFDADELFAQDPKKIRRLDLVNREYNLGAQTYYGIISLTTYQGDLQGVQLDPHTTVLDYPGIPDQREFFSPVYETEAQVNSRKPDFRTLLFWVPQIQAKADKKIPISFYSSDVPGKYAAVLQGLSGSGLPLTKVSYFEVKK